MNFEKSIHLIFYMVNLVDPIALPQQKLRRNWPCEINSKMFHNMENRQTVYNFGILSTSEAP